MSTARTLRAVSALSAALLLGAVAQARPTSYTSVGSGTWDTAGTWNPSGIPAAGDTVVISAGDTVTVDAAHEILSVTVQSSGGNVGHLDITGTAGTPASLKLLNSGMTAPTLAINAADGVRITNQYAKLIVANDLTVTGSGSLKGQDNGAVIEIAPGSGTVTLQNNVEFHGQFTMQEQASVSGTSNFFNNVRVKADVNGGTILFASSLNSLADNGNPDQWYVSASGAAMTFGLALSNLTGGFKVAGGGTMTFNATSSSLGSSFILESNGLLVFNASLTTSGTFSIACGSNSVEVDVNKATFTYSGGLGSHDCSPAPPATAISTDFDCVCGS